MATLKHIADFYKVLLSVPFSPTLSITMCSVSVSSLCLRKAFGLAMQFSQVPAGAPTVVAAVDYPEQLVGHLAVSLAQSSLNI